MNWIDVGRVEESQLRLRRVEKNDEARLSGALRETPDPPGDFSVSSSPGLRSVFPSTSC